MRELTVIGLDLDGTHVICESPAVDGEAGTDKFRLRIDDRLQAATRGEGTRISQKQIDGGPANTLRPKDIQSRVRAGASVQQIADAAGVDIGHVERFAYPVLLERIRVAEMAQAAHPVLDDGPSLLTLSEVVVSALVARGLDCGHNTWDSWRTEDGRWTIQLSWKAGRSDNVAHFCYTPGSHGGTVTAIDDPAAELIDPDFERPLRPVAPVAAVAPVQSDAEDGPDGDAGKRAANDRPAGDAAGHTPVPGRSEDTAKEHAEESRPAPRSARGKPPVPGWEDVLLGVRSAGQR